MRQEPDRGAQDRYAEEKNSRRSQLRAAKVSNLIATVGVIVPSMGLVGLYATLVQTRNQFALDERPYITADPAFYGDLDHKKIDNPIDGQPLIFTLALNNIGKSPARNVTVRRYIFFGPDARTELLRPRGNPDYLGKQLFFPNQPQSTTAITQRDSRNNQTAVIHPSDIVKWDGSYPIIVFGNIYYSDAFRHTYCTEFAWAQLGPKMSAWLDVSGNNTQGCENP